MKQNVGSFDAAGRVVLGLALFVIAHHYRTWWGLVGLAPFLTGVVSFCPLYCLFGYSTTSQDEYDDRHLPPPSSSKNV